MMLTKTHVEAETLWREPRSAAQSQAHEVDAAHNAADGESTPRTQSRAHRTARARRLGNC